MFGIQINFKNGEKDWIDPVDKTPIEKDGKLYVEGVYTYDYDASEIKEWFKYELCNVCKYDKRSYGCTNGKCENPS